MSESTERKVLGKSVKYPQYYSPEILEAIPRIFNRKMNGIDEQNLPFTGVDVWHAYEFSFLTNKGLPVTGVLKIIFPAESPYIVESKSFKLYLNSFNMERYGNSASEGVLIVIEMIKSDLSKILNCNIQICFFNNHDKNLPFDFHDFTILENEACSETISFTTYNETPDLLLLSDNPLNEIKVATNLLRSSCRITHQPDWGSAFIFIKGKKIPSNQGLLKYLVSIRNENHFHEEICELIFFRLKTIFEPEALMVTCIYTRRGGIDICPIRVSNEVLLPENLSCCNQLSSKLLRQ